MTKASYVFKGLVHVGVNVVHAQVHTNQFVVKWKMVNFVDRRKPYIKFTAQSS